MRRDHFYVYALCYPDGRPFYIGKGKGERKNEHERAARRGEENHRCQIIRAIWVGGGQVQKVILFETDNEQRAYKEEIRHITSAEKGILTNKTIGGRGRGKGGGVKISPLKTTRQPKQFPIRPVQVSPRDASTYSSLSREEIEEAAVKGRVKVYRSNKTVLIDLASLDRFIKRHRVSGLAMTTFNILHGEYDTKEPAPATEPTKDEEVPS